MSGQIRHHEIITRFMAVTLILAILFQVSGCQSHRRLRIKADPATGEYDRDELERTLGELQGKKIQLRLKDGRKLNGIVLDYQDSVLQMEVENKEKDQWTGGDIVTKHKESFDRADITSIRSHGTDAGMTAGVSILFIGAAVAGLFIYMASASGY